MENLSTALPLNATRPAPERRHLLRTTTSLYLHYETISHAQALQDPYDDAFNLPQSVKLHAALNRLDQATSALTADLLATVPVVARALDLMEQKLQCITQAFYAHTAKNLPPLSRANISQSGVAFYAKQAIATGDYVHLILNRPDHAFHIAATAQIVYCEAEDLEGFRTGAHFISLRTEDRTTLAHYIQLSIYTQANALMSAKTSP